jgi:hypothetical protein
VSDLSGHDAGAKSRVFRSYKILLRNVRTKWITITNVFALQSHLGELIPPPVYVSHENNGLH